MIALVGGLNVFWVLVLKLIFKCLVRNVLDASLRKEHFPGIVKEGDNGMICCLPKWWKRKFLSGTPWQKLTTDEMVADIEL